MPLINYYNFRGAGGDLPLNGKTMTFTTTAATEPGDFLYYASATATAVTPFSSGDTTGFYFVGIAKTAAAANGTVTAWVDNNFTGKSWKTVWSSTWSGSVDNSNNATFSGATLVSGAPIRITGSTTATYGSDSSFSAKEIGSSNTQIHSFTYTEGNVGVTATAYAKFVNGTLSFSGYSERGGPCGSAKGSCTIVLTKIEQYY